MLIYCLCRNHEAILTIERGFAIISWPFSCMIDAMILAIVRLSLFISLEPLYCHGLSRVHWPPKCILYVFYKNICMATCVSKKSSYIMIEIASCSYILCHIMHQTLLCPIFIYKLYFYNNVAILFVLDCLHKVWLEEIKPVKFSPYCREEGFPQTSELTRQRIIELGGKDSCPNDWKPQ